MQAIMSIQKATPIAKNGFVVAEPIKGVYRQTSKLMEVVEATKSRTGLCHIECSSQELLDNISSALNRNGLALHKCCATQKYPNTNRYFVKFMSTSIKFNPTEIELC